MIPQERQKIRHLLVIKDRQGKKVVPLTENLYSLGRSTDNSIVLNGSSVSRVHATIVKTTTPDNVLTPYQLIDGDLQGLKSTNGMTVNGTKCDRHNLQHGDFIELGNSVKLTYYTLFNLLDREFAEFCEIENSSEVVQKSLVASQTVSDGIENITEIDRQSLIHLASFSELAPQPIIEIDLLGSVTYANPAAIHKFPRLKQLNREHPVITDLPALFTDKAQNYLVREIEFQQKLFQQSIRYLVKEQSILIFITEIATRDEKTQIQGYSDRLLSEVMASVDLDFETKIQTILEIGCHLFDLETGFIGKLKNNSLEITAIHHTEGINFLERNKIYKISSDSEDRSLRLFQFTVNSFEPIALKYFEKIDNNSFLPSNKTLLAYKIPISSYIGIGLTVGNKPYGILSFFSPLKKIGEFSSEQTDFLQIMSRCLIKEITNRQIELVLKKLVKQKNYYQQIARDIRQPIDELLEITQQLIDSHSEAEALKSKKESLSSLIQSILAI